MKDFPGLRIVHSTEEQFFLGIYNSSWVTVRLSKASLSPRQLFESVSFSNASSIKNNEIPNSSANTNF